MKKFSKKVLFCGMTALIAAALISCDDGKKTGSTPIDPDDPEEPTDRPAYLVEEAEWPFEYEPGQLNYVSEEISGNFVLNGDADGYAPSGTKVQFTGEKGVEIVEAEGGTSGKCFRVRQNRKAEGEDDEWQEFSSDITSLYGQGKSFLLSFSLKADPDAAAEGFASDGESLVVSYSVYSGSVKEWAKAATLRDGNIDEPYEYYDFKSKDPLVATIPGIVDPWGGDFYTNPVYEKQLGVELSTTGSALAGSDWKQYAFIIPAEEIEAKVNNTGLCNLAISLYMGENAVSGYSYLIDDIVVKDLNPEIFTLGQTWFDPTESAEE